MEVYMATRGVIAQPRGDSWEGRYHHWDSYPSGLGKSLWDLVQSRGLDWARKTLIDEHEGWSTINGKDWALAPGYDELRNGPESNRPQCYCHGDRHETLGMVRREDDNWGTEYAYILGNQALVIETRAGDRWQTVASIPWARQEPDWDALEGGM